MPPLSMMIKPVSSSCNMRCKYCFYADVTSLRNISNYGIMSRETMQQVIRKAFLYADGSVSFAFQGGEPTLAGSGFYEDFVRTVRQVNVRGLPVSYALQTNGYELSDAFCRFLAAHHFLVGVSVDGVKDIHNGLRRDAQGEGTFARVMGNIERLRQYGIEYNILCVVTAPVAERAKECWQNLARHGFLQFIPCIDDFHGPAQNWSLTAEAYGHFLIDVFSCYEHAWRKGNPVSERRFDNYLGVLLGQPPEDCGMRGLCGLYFLVEADGSVYPCDFYVLDEWRMGNLNLTSLGRMAKAEASLKFREISRTLPSSCNNCEWLRLCRGGCRRDREPFRDGRSGENKYCAGYRMFFEECFSKMRSLAEYIRKERQLTVNRP